MKKLAPMKTEYKELGSYVTLREILEEVEYLKENTVEDIWFDAQSDGYGSAYIYIYYHRPLTDEEIKKKEEEEIRHAQKRIDMEKAEYLRLKEKYEGGNEN